MKQRKKPQDLRQRALALLARRDYSRQQLARRLQRHTTNSAALEDLLDDLEARNWLSDARFCETFCRNALAKGYGERRIRHELAMEGIESRLIDSTLEALQIDWYQQAVNAYNRRFSGCEPGDRKGMARRLRYMQSRGFSMDQIRAAMAWLPDDEDNFPD